jgi:hypothetical protein
MRIVVGGLLALLVASGASTLRAGAQEMGASVSAPFRHDIDAQCDPLEKTPARSWIHFQRLTGRPGVTPHWTPQVSLPPRAGAATAEDETLDVGTYAHVVRKHGHVVYARLAELRPNGELGDTDTYCYAGDRLIRLRTEIVVPQTTGTLTRTKYYDGGKLLTHTEQKANFSAEDLKKAARVPDRTPVYLRPSALPFYAVMMHGAAASHAPK